MFNISIIIALGAAVLAILYGYILRAVVLRKPEGGKKIIDAAKEIQTEERKNLYKKYSLASMMATILFVILLYIFGWQIAIGFLVGAVFSVLVGLLGINLLAGANSRMIEASKKDLPTTFNIVFKSGSATGLFAAGLGLAATTAIYIIFKDFNVLFGLAFGVSVVSFFSRGESMVADLFETNLLALVAAMLLAKIFLANLSDAILFPIVLSAAFIIANIISTWFVRLSKNSKNIIGVIYRGLIIDLVLSAIAFYFIAHWMIKINIIQNLSGYYGFAMLLVFILSVLGSIISLVILEQSAKDATLITRAVELPSEVQVNIDALGTASVKAEKITKYFSILSAFILAVVMFAAFGQKILQANSALSFDLRDYHIFLGLFIGGISSYCFYLPAKKTTTMTVKGIVVSSSVAILLTVFVGFILGPVILGGFLIGATLTGLFLAMSASTTIMNSIIKTVSVVALLIVPVIISLNLNTKYKLIVSAILAVLMIVFALVFSSKNKSKFLKWLHWQ